ncbi:hypothetical protein MCUN1_003718 [Malassezia cuniculi]|uniref:Uncharacterized protein n=1 Tax=Malassezia cuniculi TaxID=948313 RepID=A0AAF0ETL0_9BASI|nr:hypothetical protein MCUN1_003718 [Malassezia cuniculi]
MSIFAHLTSGGRETPPTNLIAAEGADDAKRSRFGFGALRRNLPLEAPPQHSEYAVPGAALEPSRMSQFALRLNEVVNKVFLSCTANTPSSAPQQSQFPHVPRLKSVVYDGKHLPDRARVIELTLLVVGELQYAASVDAYLLRAVSRAVLKSLTQFVARIESLLVPTSRDSSAIVIPSSARAANHLPAAMEFNLGLMALEWLLEESLERCLEGLPPLVLAGSTVNHVETAADDMAQPAMPTFAHEILSPLREKMEASILHVVQPILSALRASLTTCILKASPSPFLPRNLAVDTPVQPWHRELEERLEAAYRLLVPRLSDRCGEDGHAWFISVAIHVIWKGLVVLTSRSVMEPVSSVESQLSNPSQRISSGATSGVLLSLLARDSSPTRRVPTPMAIASALRNSLSRPQSRNRYASSGEESPEITTPDEEARMILTVAADEENGYVVNPLLVAEQVYDLQMFERMVLNFCGEGTERHRFGFLRRRSEGDSYAEDEDDIALAALQEALDALQSTIAVLRYLMQDPNALLRLETEEEAETLPKAFQVIPPIMLLHICMGRMPLRESRGEQSSSPEMLLPPPPSMYDYSWMQYESALMGFGSGESASHALVQRYRAISEEARKHVESKLVLADHEALLSDVHDNASVSSYSSSGTEIPASMVQSAPTIQPNTKERSVERGEARDISRSRQPHRGPARFWRRAHSQTRLNGGPGMFTALPPRVSRTHATSSPTGPRRDLVISQSMRAHRRTVPSYAVLQRQGLDMADAVFSHIERVLA